MIRRRAKPSSPLLHPNLAEELASKENKENHKNQLIAKIMQLQKSGNLTPISNRNIAKELRKDIIRNHINFSYHGRNRSSVLGLFFNGEYVPLALDLAFIERFYVSPWG